MQSNSKYADTLYNACKDSSLLNTINKELKHVEYLFKKVPAFRLVLITKRIENSKKTTIIKSALYQFNPIIIEFLSAIINNNQSNELLDIIHRFNRIVNTKSDFKEIDIITSEKIHKSYLENIVQIISDKLSIKSKVNHNVNPEIIGGMQLRIGNKVFDNSISHQLNQLRKTLHNM